MKKLQKILDKSKEAIEALVDGKIAYGQGKEWILSWMKDAYNLALEDAAENAKTGTLVNGNIPEEAKTIVDKLSILKLKI